MPSALHRNKALLVLCTCLHGCAHTLMYSGPKRSSGDVSIVTTVTMMGGSRAEILDIDGVKPQFDELSSSEIDVLPGCHVVRAGRRGDRTLRWQVKIHADGSTSSTTPATQDFTFPIVMRAKHQYVVAATVPELTVREVDESGAVTAIFREGDTNCVSTLSTLRAVSRP